MICCTDRDTSLQRLTVHREESGTSGHKSVVSETMWTVEDHGEGSGQP